jgi:CxxC motif-containing protein (DUF1111 family)
MLRLSSISKWISLLPLLILISLTGCSDPVGVQATEEDILSGGATSIFDESARAFAQAAPNLSSTSRALFAQGETAFATTFRADSAGSYNGPGPVLNHVSCSGCHPSAGRGEPTAIRDSMGSMLLRISIPGTDEHGGPSPVPGFGGQLQQLGVPGSQGEGEMSISYVEIEGSFADGAKYSLRKPVYSISSTYIPLPAGVAISPRVAPPVFGLGLLEAIPEQVILSLADEFDINGDGISGRANRVWNPQGGATLGRFGWKGGMPTLLVQTAAAYNEDMGITSDLFRVESCHGQSQYAGDGDRPEVEMDVLKATTHYVRTLAVPARRNFNDAKVIEGGRIFRRANCSSCHVINLTTGHSDLPELSNQKILAYTDLLLHDMGEGLADGRPEFLATGSEWRTPSLWGIGLTRVVNGHTFFLHDGRARSLMEAVMWHGGEAERSKEYVRKLKREDREALIAYLESL